MTKEEVGLDSLVIRRIEKELKKLPGHRSRASVMGGIFETEILKIMAEGLISKKEMKLQIQVIMANLLNAVETGSVQQSRDFMDKTTEEYVKRARQKGMWVNI